MGRIRTIKPEFPQSESMGRVSREARYCFIMLWTMADDSGRLRGASRMLASLLFPYDDDAPSLIDGWLAELADQNCILRYAAEGTQYIQIVKWLEHQKIDKPSASRIPGFVEASRTLAKPRECSAADMDLGPRTKDQEGSSEAKASGVPLSDGDWLFADGLTWLTGKDVADKEARSMIGRWRKIHGDDQTRRAIEAAMTENPIEPVAWITAAMQSRSRPRDGPAVQRWAI